MNFSGALLAASLLALGATLPGCKTQQKTTASTSSKPTNTTSQITSVRMGRGACFGKCPVYDIELSRDGQARYHGKTFVAKEGVYEKMLDKAAVGEIFQMLSAARPDTMQTVYERLVTDLPSINYVIYYSSGKSQNIQNAQDGPPILRKIAGQMDALVKQPDFSWKKLTDKVEGGQ